MAIIKCKMCGGDITIAADKTFGTCEYCGSTMTLPKVDDDQRAAAFNRGNHFRRIGEFDKALAVYERIVAEDNTDAEAHWCCALCRFGIEYVEDPATYEYLPTCHRASFDSILEDVDYLAAVEYSDGITRRQYQKDAAKIAEVQRGILATSSQEEPFDVFICYKESDAEGNRTRDSLLAQEVYYQLTEQGYRVFFSRITLEDKVGAQYEPYIFAALNSAKVMVAIGTKEEHFNAVWVKNEWSRFLALMKKDRSKLLLPCYRDMDPYDMPEALSVLQSYDMGKIGFIQDLVRGIGKVLHTEPVQTVKETVVVQSQQTSSANTAPLLKRAFMFLEDKDWESADEYCEKVLDIDPECADAYLCKALVEGRYKSLNAFIEERIALGSKVTGEKKTVPPNRVHIQEMVDKYELKNYLAGDRIRQLYNYDLTYTETADSCQRKLSEEEDYWKNHKFLSRAEKFAAGGAAEVLCAKEKILSALRENVQCAKKEDETAPQRLQERYAIQLAAADKKAAQLRGEAEERREMDYRQLAVSAKTSEYIFELKQTVAKLTTFDGYKDSRALISLCNERIEKIEATEKAAAEEKRLAEEAEAARQAAIKAEEERIRAIEAKKRAAKKKKITAIVAAVAVVAIVVVLVVTKVVVPSRAYNDAIALMDACKYDEAITAFEALDGYKDSTSKISMCNTAIMDSKYNDAIALMDAGKYDEAITVFEVLDGYKDSANKISVCNATIMDDEYNDAIALLDAGNIVKAYEMLIALDGYKDSADKANSIYDKYKTEKLRSATVGDYLSFGVYEQDNNTSNGKESVEWRVLAIEGGKALVISKYALDYQPYHLGEIEITWEDCTLRQWLNNDFLNAVFSASERKAILTTTVSPDKNLDYEVKPENSTRDKMFLLSLSEVNKYFFSNGQRQCELTKYAHPNGEEGDTGYWWLRTQSSDPHASCGVRSNGELGSSAIRNVCGVRPAMWIDLNA